MLSPTLQEGLTSYGIGETIRTLRLKKKMGLVEMGRHSGLSPALLSKIERGKLFPTLPTLLRIAMVFSLGLDYFFAAGRERRHVGVVRRKDRLRLPEPGETKDPGYTFESLDFTAVERRTHAFFVDFQPQKGTKLRTHAHPGGEFIYVLEGTLELTVGLEEVSLDAQDSAYFDASRPHGYHRASAKPCRAIVVTSPS